MRMRIVITKHYRLSRVRVKVRLPGWSPTPTARAREFVEVGRRCARVHDLTKITACLLLSLGSAACGTPSLVDIRGTLGGKKLVAVAGLYSPANEVSADPNSVVTDANGRTGLTVTVSTAQSICADLMDVQRTAGARALKFTLEQPAPVALGRYTMTSWGADSAAGATRVMGAYEEYDSACQIHISERTTTGTLTLSEMHGDTLEGDFDVTFDNGDKVSGSFVADPCWGLTAPAQGLRDDCHADLPLGSH